MVTLEQLMQRRPRMMERDCGNKITKTSDWKQVKMLLCYCVLGFFCGFAFLHLSHMHKPLSPAQWDSEQVEVPLFQPLTSSSVFHIKSSPPFFRFFSFLFLCSAFLWFLDLYLSFKNLITRAEIVLNM